MQWTLQFSFTSVTLSGMRLVIGLILSMMIMPAWARGYTIYEENGKVGIKNESGQIVLAAAFEALGWSDGSFSVIGEVTGYRSKNQWGLLNLKKEFLTGAEYENLIYCGGDRIVASRKLNPFTIKQGCLDLTGKITVPFRYDGIKINGLRAIVFIKNGSRFEHGLIDLEDKGILPLKYKSILSLGSLRYAVQNFDNKIALFAESGIKLTDFTIDSLSSFHKGWAVIYQNFKQGVLNREGDIKAEPIYREVKVDEDGSLHVRTSNVWKVIDIQNKETDVIEVDEMMVDHHQYRIVKSGKRGTVDKQFKPIIPAHHDYLGPFNNNKAAAKKDGKFGLLRASGSLALPFLFDSLVVEGRLLRIKNKIDGISGWFLFDTLGVQKSNRAYDFIDRSNGKFFPVRSHGYYGGMDSFGKEIIHCVYDSIIQVKQDRVVVKFKKQYGIISLDETWLLAPQPHRVELVNNELYIEKQPTVNFLKSLQGETIYFSPHRLEVKEHFLNELLPNGAVHRVGLDGVTSAYEAIVADEKIFAASEGLRGLKRDGKYGFIDTQGRLTVANRYEGIGQFKEGLASVKILGKWGYVNKQDKIVINPNYEQAGDFMNGAAIIKRNGKVGLTDATGKILLALRYDYIIRDNNHFIITLNQMKGLAANDGTVLIEPRFDEITVLQNDQVIVRQNKKYGVLSLYGMSLLPIAYDQIIFMEEKGAYLCLKKSEWKNLN